MKTKGFGTHFHFQGHFDIQVDYSFMDKETWQKCLGLFDTLITSNPNFERKGKTMPYTSANGHVFSQINKASEIGIRLPKESRERFLAEHQITLFTVYDAVF